MRIFEVKFSSLTKLFFFCIGFVYFGTFTFYFYMFFTNIHMTFITNFPIC